MAARKRKVSVEKLCNSVTGNPRILGAVDGYISKAAPVDDANEQSISYYPKANEDALEIIRNSRARVIVCPEDLKFAKEDYQKKTLILVPNPKLAFVRLMQRYFQGAVRFGIDPTAVVDKDAKIHPNVHIGPHCYIGKCQIGEGTVIYGNVYIYSDVRIGRRVIINAGAVIGADGMEYAKNEMGGFEKLPHIAGILIEDDVEIGANACIMGGALGDTVIGQGSKVGPFCLVGHNAIIGKHCLIITRSVIGGSCHIGDHARVSLAACIRDGIAIGKNAFIGMGSVVTKDIGDGWIAYGVPAKEIRKVH